MLERPDREPDFSAAKEGHGNTPWEFWIEEKIQTWAHQIYRIEVTETSHIQWHHPSKGWRRYGDDANSDDIVKIAYLNWVAERILLGEE